MRTTKNFLRIPCVSAYLFCGNASPHLYKKIQWKTAVGTGLLFAVTGWLALGAFVFCSQNSFGSMSSEKLFFFRFFVRSRSFFACSRRRCDGPGASAFGGRRAGASSAVGPRPTAAAAAKIKKIVKKLRKSSRKQRKICENINENGRTSATISMKTDKNLRKYRRKRTKIFKKIWRKQTKDCTNRGEKLRKREGGEKSI